MDAELQRLWEAVERLKAAGGDEREINDLRQRIAFIERQLGIEAGLQTDSQNPAPQLTVQVRRRTDSPRVRNAPGSMDQESTDQDPTPQAVEIRNPPVSGEQQAFKQAYAAFRNGAMDQAIQLFDTFLKNHPKSELASSAVYWTGEAHFGQGRYDEAVLYFDRVIKEFPGSKKELSALLKQGQAFEKMGDTKSARIIFQKLAGEHPHSVQGRMAATRLKSLL
ncbi:MAG: tol-pal system protein YbgF [Deltaproteobacteria bacterium]|nr:tol-pal system protein YbgF [Deltaproteobacteria bacterium]